MNRMSMFFIVLPAWVLFAACSTETTDLSISTQWAQQQSLDSEGAEFVLPLSVVKLRVSVSGPNMKVVTREFDLSDLHGSTTLKVDGIPLGPQRKVDVWGLEQDGWIAYYGESQSLALSADTEPQAQVEVYAAPGATGPDGVAPELILSIDADAEATAQREVSLQLVAETAAEMFFSNTLPDPVADCAGYDWQPYSAEAVAWSIGDIDGIQTVYALVRDANGYCSRPIGDTILLDRQGPVFDQSQVIVNSRAPGSDDEVLGNVGAVGGLATVELYADAALSQKIAETTASADGAFSAISLGDNYQDLQAHESHGQKTFWLSAIDALGNRGVALSIQTDALAPAFVESKLLVSSNPPGGDDSVKSLADCSEPGSIVALLLHADDSVAQLETALANDGSFASMSLGDNFTRGGDLTGQAQFWLQVRDAAGNKSAKVQVQTDVAAPALNPNLLVVTNALPGVDDSLEGQPESSEANASLELFSDQELSQAMQQTTTAEDGSFAPISLGDNFTDQSNATVTVTGQQQYWLQATDEAGNSSAALAVAVDLAPPEVALVSSSDLMLGIGEVCDIVIHTDTDLMASPDVLLRGTGYSPACPALEASDSACCSRGADGCTNYASCCAVNTCSELDPETHNYTCHIANPSDSSIPDGADLQILLRASAQQNGNVAQIAGPSLHFDSTRPSAISLADITVHMNPSGQNDQLSAAPGSLEPGGSLRLYQLDHLINQNGMSFYKERIVLDIPIDQNGGIDHADIGDNPWSSVYARQFDAAGNDSCTGLLSGQSASNRPCGSSSIELINDIQGPLLSLSGAPESLSFSTQLDMQISAADQGPEDSQGQSLVHEPVHFECRLDDALLAPCASALSYENLIPGAHHFEILGYDAIGNPSEKTSLDWRIVAGQQVYDAPRYEALSNSAYQLDEAQLGHYFVGGDKLYHIYETTPDSFASEVIYDAPVSAPRVDFSDNAFYLVFASDALTTIRFASGSTGHWAVQNVAVGQSSEGGYDIVVNAAGEINLIYNSCASLGGDCVHNGADYNNYKLFAMQYGAQNGWTVANELPSARYAKYPLLSVDNDGDLWLVYLHADDYSYHISLRIRERSGNVWQDDLSGFADLMSSSESSRDPNSALLFSASGLMTLAYVPNNDNGHNLVEGAQYDPANSAWTSHPFATGHEQLLSAVQDSNGDLWFASQSASKLGLDRYDNTASTWSASEIPGQVQSLALAVKSPGDMASAHLQVGYSSTLTNDTRVTLGRLSLEAGSSNNQVLAFRDGLGALTMVRHAAVPTVVWQARDQDKILLSRYQSGSWQNPETVRDGLDGRVSGLQAIAMAGDIWLAYGSHSASDCSGSCIVGDHFASTDQSWHQLGPVSQTGDSDCAYSLKIALDSLGQAVVLYKSGGSADELKMTVWDGAQFSTPISVTTDLSSSLSFDVLGDANGAENSGQICVLYKNASNELSTRGFDPADLNAAPSSDCGAALPDLGFVPNQIAVAQNEQDAPIIVALGSGAQISRLTYSSGTWEHEDLGPKLTPVAFDLETQTLIADGSYSNSASYFAPPNLVFDPAGHMHMVMRTYYSYNFEGYLLFSERDDASIEVLQIKSESDYRAQIVVGLDPSEGAIMCWTDPLRADLNSVLEGSLR